MTTNEFIKLLQEEDPSGECHLRFPGGIPCYVEQKPGYYDGAYQYIDDNGNYVTSTKNNKIDLYCLDISDFVEKHFDDVGMDNWEEIKAKFKFELDGHLPIRRKERVERVIAKAKEAFDEEVKMYQEIIDESTSQAIESYKDGHRWFENKENGNWISLDENGNVEEIQYFNKRGIYQSGLFEKVDNNEKQGNYQWIKKENN